MRIIGLDLSLTSTGVADYLSDGGATVSRIQTKANGTTLGDRARRLDHIANEVIGECLEHPRARMVAIEGPSFGQARQGGQHDRAGLWWMVVNALHVEGVPVAEVSPATVKKYATGKGNASKDEVLAAVVRRYPDVPVMGNDEADALVLVAMAAHHYQVSTLPTVPQSHATALAKVNWPEVDS